MKKMFVLKDIAQKEILTLKFYDTTENIDIEILEDFPQIEEIEGKIGKYIINGEGNIDVEYTDIPKSEIDILKEENDSLKERMAVIQESTAELTIAIMGGEI